VLASRSLIVSNVLLAMKDLFLYARQSRALELNFGPLPARFPNETQKPGVPSGIIAGEVSVGVSYRNFLGEITTPVLAGMEPFRRFAATRKVQDSWSLEP
jgi:hypothetical protein